VRVFDFRRLYLGADMTSEPGSIRRARRLMIAATALSWTAIILAIAHH
jgi:hypothetical protein